ncbi:MAG: damage-inducible protein DinB, partial [Alphaproteobacteria bacterium]|nr:damage-inducible protein DinB [Alphaproteobacteria bacterium]
DELGERLAATDAWYRAYVAGVTEAELAETITFAFVGDDDAGAMTRAQILAHIITHGAAHRGAIGKMMEDAGIPGAPDMVTTLVSRGG